LLCCAAGKKFVAEGLLCTRFLLVLVHPSVGCTNTNKNLSLLVTVHPTDGSRSHSKEWVTKKTPIKLSSMDLVKYIFVSMILFLLGIWGIFLNRKNIIIMLMSIELMLLAVNLNFLLFSVYLDDMIGQLFALFVLTVAAAESAIGLALLVIYYRVRGTIAVEFINLIKG
jgi:NADH:ubiquinone oxidoreductase subunit K